MSPGTSREFRLANRVEELGPLCDALWTFCLDQGLSEEEAADIRLAVDELVSNTIRHGYTDPGVHEIRLRATVTPRELSLEIEDDARPFNPLEAPLPDVTRPVEEKPIGGLGILLTRSVMDRLEYRRTGDRNILTAARTIRRASR